MIDQQKRAGLDAYSVREPATRQREVTGRLAHTSRHRSEPDLLCLSHLRWNFVFQRPQHLLVRAAEQRRVFFVEEPVFHDGAPCIEIRQERPQLWVVVPHLPGGLDDQATTEIQQDLIDELLRTQHIDAPILWYYTPAALAFTRHVNAVAAVYDCMDELSLFQDAPEQLRNLERELFARVDLVFTGGRSLYEAKRSQHPSVHLFPSSVDLAHFGQARHAQPEPADQAAIPHPRLGYFGVVDERMDRELLAAVAQARPDWHLVLVGPVVKIDPAALPQAPNIHYLGGKTYSDLPAYLAGWDVALLPFARNDATRFISPTKTPEYLAGGKPVVATPIRDVVRPYGDKGLVRIAATSDEFVAAVDGILSQPAAERSQWLSRVDAMLSGSSWDKTWSHMSDLIDLGIAMRRLSALGQMP